jgi:hypothetical protein
MAEIIGVEKPLLDVIVYVMVGGIELPIECPIGEPNPDFEKDIVRGRSYNNKRNIYINMRNVCFIDRITEAEYLDNIEEARRRQLMQRGEGLAIPGMMIPRKLRNN